MIAKVGRIFGIITLENQANYHQKKIDKDTAKAFVFSTICLNCDRLLKLCVSVVRNRTTFMLQLL